MSIIKKLILAIKKYNADAPIRRENQIRELEDKVKLETLKARLRIVTNKGREKKNPLMFDFDFPRPKENK